MYFENRLEAGKLLSEKLKKYKNKACIVYAIPRGGVVIGAEIARKLSCPLDIVVTKKIVSPQNLEYAIGAINESGDVFGNKSEFKRIDEEWISGEIKRQKEEIKRRNTLYRAGREEFSATDRIAIIVDDGVATGYTMRAAIAQLRKKDPDKIVVAVPIVSESIARLLAKEADSLVALSIVSEREAGGAVSFYYRYFPQVTDSEVINALAFELEDQIQKDALANDDLLDFDDNFTSRLLKVRPH